MTKTPTPLHLSDLSGFTRALARQLGPGHPGHLALMNMVARAAGYQNVQHLRAEVAAAARLERQTERPVMDARAVERALQQFDAAGRLRQWPSRQSVQTLALWALWAALPAQTSMREADVTRHFAPAHLFNDPATLRRTMIACGLLTRARDGTDYRRVEREPPAEAKAVLREISARRRAQAATGRQVSHV